MAPISAAPRIERWRATIVEMAMTWSASVAWRMPRKNPSASSESVVPKSRKREDNLDRFLRRDEATPGGAWRQASS